MTDLLRDFLKSGKKLLDDTKAPKRMKKQPDLSEMETDPHRVFVKRTINEKPKPKDLVKELKRFIDAAEAEL